MSTQCVYITRYLQGGTVPTTKSSINITKFGIKQVMSNLMPSDVKLNAHNGQLLIKRSIIP